MKIIDVTQSLVTEISPNKMPKQTSVEFDEFDEFDKYDDTLRPISGFGYIAGTGLNGKPAKFAVKHISDAHEYVILLPAPKIKSQYLNLAAQILAFIWLDEENYSKVNINFSKINNATNAEQLRSALSQQRINLSKSNPNLDETFVSLVRDATYHLQTHMLISGDKWPWMLSTSATANFASNKPDDYIKVGQLGYVPEEIGFDNSDQVIRCADVLDAAVDSAYQGQSLMWALYYGLITHTHRNLMSHGSHSPGAAKTWSRLGESKGVRIWALDDPLLISQVYPTISTASELKVTINGRVNSVYKSSLDLTLLAVSRGSIVDKVLEKIAVATQQREKPVKKTSRPKPTTEVDEEQTQISEPLTDTTGLSSWRGFCPVAE